MPPKRRAAAPVAPESASKRSKTVKNEESGAPLRQSPRKPRTAVPASAPNSKDKAPTSRGAGKTPGLKSFLSNGTEQDKAAIKRAVEAAVKVAEESEEDEQRKDEPEPGDSEGSENFESKQKPKPAPKAKAKPEPKAKAKSTPAKKSGAEEKPPPKSKAATKSTAKDTDQPSRTAASGRGKKAKSGSDEMAAPLAQRTTGLQHYIGAHVSIAKGIHNGVLNARSIGANAFAIFLKSQRKWDNPALQDSSVTTWHDACKEHSYTASKHTLPHGSYLVNLASQTPEQHEKSVSSFLDDLNRCERLGIGLYNFHPGNTNGAPKAEACKKIADAINLAHEKTDKVIPVLETMASNKATSNTVGGKFEDLAMIIKDVKDKERVGVCIDTCHVFAAGYDIVSKEGFKKTMEDFDRIIGRKYLRAWHLNDSKAVMNSGRDLHANIGTGFIGLRGFWNVMNMDIWGKGVGVVDLPMILETPIDEEGGGMVPKKGEKREEDKSVWAREIKLLESLIGMDPESAEFKDLEKELFNRGAGQREKMTTSIDKMLAKGKGKAGKGKEGKKDDSSAEEDD